jgi:hypothetical protein
MFDYPEMAAVARELLIDFGQSGFVRRQTVTGGSPSEETAGTANVVSYAATFAIIPIETQQVGQAVGDTAIRITDRRVYMAANVAIAPRGDDRLVTAAGDVMTILRCLPIAPAGVTVAYDIVARA